MEKTNSDKDVIIKLKKWQIPYLLGSARLGIWAEDWCARLAETSVGTYDTDSARWIQHIGHLLEIISTQSNSKEENKGYYTRALNQIDSLVEKECKRNVKKVNERIMLEEKRYG